MRIGAFEIPEPIPPLDKPILLMSLTPWINVGSVGTLTLSFLEEQLKAQELGELEKPDVFYDFTRYRPIIRRKEGKREIHVPTTVTHWAREPSGRDWIFVQAMEPHSHALEFVSSLAALMKSFGVQQYGLVGAMYAPVPHTRPPTVSGSSTEPALQERLNHLDVKASAYEGPTSIVSTLTEQVQQAGTKSLTLVVQLPAYAQLDLDYRGHHTLLKLLTELYSLSVNLRKVAEEGNRQYAAVEQQVRTDPRLRRIVAELESTYDAKAASHPTPQEPPSHLPPDVERFLKDLEQD